MVGVDESRTFYPLRIAVLTVSDSRTEETDKSGALLAESSANFSLRRSSPLSRCFIPTNRAPQVLSCPAACMSGVKLFSASCTSAITSLTWAC